MAVNLIKVDYEAIPTQTAAMKSQGKELNAELINVYKSIESMHKSWYGQRYNSLVKEFNKIIPSLNEMLELVIGDIPFALDTVANNYALADKGSTIRKAAKETPNKISNLPISSDTGMRFIETEVSTVQQNVSKNFENAIQKMGTIETTFGKIQWESNAAETFKSRFKKLKNEIVENFNNLNSQFTNLINQTIQDIQTTETSNTVN